MIVGLYAKPFVIENKSVSLQSRLIRSNRATIEGFEPSKRNNHRLQRINCITISTLVWTKAFIIS